MVELSSILFVGICFFPFVSQKIHLNLGFRVGNFHDSGHLDVIYVFFLNSKFE